MIQRLGICNQADQTGKKEDNFFHGSFFAFQNC
jgi:hypothetical protein